MNSVNIRIDRLRENKGQIPGVPENPRTIELDRFELLKKSISELPDMLSLRELLVVKFNDDYIIIGGNMRYRACMELGYNEIPCKVIPSDTPAEKLRAIVIQDNNEYGKTDWDVIASCWDVNEISNFGVELPEEWNVNESEYGDEFSLPTGGKNKFQQITFTLANEQADTIRRCIQCIDNVRDTFGNENKNGNSLYEIVRQWEELRI